MLFHTFFDASNDSFLCVFTEEYYYDKSCLIKYGIINCSNQTCEIKYESRNSSNNNTLTDTVTILIPTLPPTDHESEYCFIAIGRVGNLTIAVEGTFSVKGKKSTYSMESI